MKTSSEKKHKAVIGGDIMKRLNAKGQGMLEYIVIIAVVLAAILVFANGGLKTAMKAIFDQTGTEMNDTATKINIVN